MEFSGIVARIEEAHPSAVIEQVVDEEVTKDPFAVLDAERLREVMQTLRDDGNLAFDLLLSVAAVDYPEAQPKAKKKADPPPDPIPGRFELVYHMLSSVRNHRFVVKIKLPHVERPVAPTVCDIYPTAEWHEREAWDLMGVHFHDHPDMRRVLCVLDWVGHPLRKDYVFPTEYHGISCE
ncbi:MAG: NADH-quinone oxidoreductase subunit C [Planctomycetes bacterium]|jgi:NADH-quinone oxidoreductase subunit C|nr:NADH-quinone oxidoreductase subunit C [Planctomycetota bacterium]